MSESYNEPSTGGTKGNAKSYTANPRAPKGDDINEPTGAVTSDSLANESIQAQGGFSQNANPEVLSVKGSNSTLANDNTSGAVTLDASRNAGTRDGNRFTSESYNPQDGSQERGVYNTQRNTSDGGTAPTYTDTSAFRTDKPKGKDLIEDDNMNRPTDMGEIGSKKDPGRLAELKFQKTDAAVAGVTRDIGGSNENEYGTLNSSEDA